MPLLEGRVEGVTSAPRLLQVVSCVLLGCLMDVMAMYQLASWLSFRKSGNAAAGSLQPPGQPGDSARLLVAVCSPMFGILAASAALVVCREASVSAILVKV